MNFNGLTKAPDNTGYNLGGLEGPEVKKPGFHPGRLVGAVPEGLKDFARRKVTWYRSHLEQTAPDEEWRAEMDRLNPEWRRHLLIENPELAGEVDLLVSDGMDPETARQTITDRFMEEKHQGRLDFIRSVEEADVLESAPEFAGQSSGTAEDVIRTVTSSGPDVLGLMLSPWVGVPLMYTSIAGALTEEMETQAEASNMELDDKLKERIYSAAAGGALFSLPLELIGNIFKIKAITGSGPWTSRLMALGSAFMGEAATEFVQQYPETMAVAWALNPDLSGEELHDHLQDLALSYESFTDALYSGWVGGWAGATTGAIGQSVVGLGSRLIHPKQRRILEDRAARIKDYMHKDLDPEQQKEFLRLVGMDPEAIETPQEIADIVQRVKSRILFQGEPIKTDARDRLIENLEGGKLPQKVRELYLSVWDGMAHAATDQGLIEKPEQFYEQWLGDVRFTPQTEFEAEQAAYQAAWRSQLKDTIADKLPGKGTGPQLAQTVQSWAKKGMFKQEELDWLGLTDWLKGQGKVTKDEILEYINEHSVEIEEVEKTTEIPPEARDKIDEAEKLAGRAQESYNEIADRLRRQIMEAGETGATAVDVVQTLARDPVDPYRRQKLADVLGDHDLARTAALDLHGAWDNYLRANEMWDRLEKDVTREKGPVHGQWVLPGGENYKELLLTLPSKIKGKAEIVPVGPGDPNEEGFYVVTGTGERFWYRYLEDAQNFAETIIGGPDAFISDHWQEPNVLAHIRFNERVDADGNKVLFIEEVQSDWHQAGRKKGYRRTIPFTRDDIIVTEGEHEYFIDVKPPHGPGTALRAIGKGVVKDAETARDYAYNVLKKYIQPKTKGVPEAPFKKSWPLLTIKRMVQYAAENGFDKIAWTTGAQQVERYETALRQRVDRIVTWPAQPVVGEGRAIAVLAYKNDGLVFEEYMPVEGTKKVRGKDASLEDIVGVKLAEQIRKNPEAEYEFTGEDLTIGGEGMQAFYDRILPNEVNKFFNKKTWGQAKVEPIEILYLTEPDELSYQDVDYEKVWSLPITDQMRQATTGPGMVLFQQPAEFKPAKQLELDLTPKQKKAIEKLPEPERYQKAVMRTTGNIAAAGQHIDGMKGAANLLAGIRKSAQELAYMVATDKSGRVLEIHRYTKGLRGSSQISAAEVAGRLLNIPGATNAYFIHNHPSGKTTPSKDDTIIHQELYNIAALADIDLESGIIGGTEWRQFDMQGPITLSEPLEAQLRKEQLPEKERRLVVGRGKDQPEVNNPEAAAKYLEDQGKIDQDGILFFNSKNQPVGWLPWPAGKSAKEASREILAFAESTNAAAYIVNSAKPLASIEYIVELARDLKATGGPQLHDVLDQKKSLVSTDPGFGKAISRAAPATSAFGSYGVVADPNRTIYQDKRGAVQYLFDNTPKIIHLFESADISTALHETGHLLLEMIYRSGSVDYQAAAEWAGVDEERFTQGTSYWTDEELERFAKAWELYLMEGKAPTSRLQMVFKKLKDALLAVYKSLANKYFSDVKINDDMRALFDRWLASELERATDPVLEVSEWLRAGDLEMAEADLVKAEEQRRALNPGSIAEMEYEDLVAQARRAVGIELAKRKEKLERDLRREFKKEAQQSIEDDPFYDMLDAIVKAGGLRRSSLRSLYDDQWIAEINLKRPGLISRSEDALPPDVLAQEWGYNSTDEMVQDILYRPNKKEAVEEYFKSLWSEYERTEHLANAVAYEDILELEIELLGRLMGRKKPKVRRDLKKIIRQKTGQIKTPDSRQLAEDLKRDEKVARDAWREAKKAYRDEFNETLSAEKRAQAARLREQKLDQIARLRVQHMAKMTALKNYYRDNRDKEKIHRKLGRMIRHKSMLPEFKKQILNILGRYYQVPKSFRLDPPTETLEQFLDGLEADGEQIDIIKMLLTKLPPPRSKGKLSIDEVRTVGDLVSAIAHIEKTERDQRLIDSKQKHQEVVDSIVDTIYAEHKVTAEERHPLNVDERIGFLQSMSESAKAYFAQLKKAEFIIRAADGWKDFGATWNNLFKPIKDAEDAELELNEEYFNELQGLFKGFDRTWANKLYRINGIPEPISKEKMIMLMLNSGNKGNREAIKVGNGVTDEILTEIAGKLTQKEIDLVYRTWDLIDSLFPRLNETHKKLTGVELRKVEGKYFPLVFSRKLSWKAGEFQAQREMRDMFASAYVRPKVESGHRIERKGGKLPVDLRFDVIARHVQNVIHDVTHQIPVRNVQRILFDPKFRTAMTAGLGEDAYKQLTPWLQEVAKPRRDPMSILEKWVGRVRRNATVVALGLKLTVAQKQTLSLTQTMHELGTLETLGAMAKFYTDPWAMRRFVNERSPSIRNRRKSFDRELQQFYSGFNPTEWKGAGILRDSFFSLISLMDSIATYPTWIAGYNVGMKRFDGNEAKAIELADQVVRRTQPVARAKDLADIQRGGELKKTLVMFYTFFSVFQNRMMELHARRRGGRMNAIEMLKSYWLLVIVPGILGTLVNEREWDTETIIKGIVSYRLGGMPGIRDLAQGILSDYGYAMTPVASFGEEVAYLGKAAEKGKYERLPKHLIYVAGYTAGLPSAQINIAMDGMIDMIQGKTKNPVRLLFREKKESKK